MFYKAVSAFLSILKKLSLIEDFDLDNFTCFGEGYEYFEITADGTWYIPTREFTVIIAPRGWTQRRERFKTRQRAQLAAISGEARL